MLACHVTAQIHVTEDLGVGRHMKEDGSGEFVPEGAALVECFENMDAIPDTIVFGRRGNFCQPPLTYERRTQEMNRIAQTFLQQNHASEPIIQIPEIHTRHAPFKVQSAVYIERLVHRNLQLPQRLARHRAFVLQRRVKLIAPRTAITVSITVVVA